MYIRIIDFLIKCLYKIKFRRNVELYISGELVKNVKSFKLHEVDNLLISNKTLNSTIETYIADIGTNGYLEVFLYYDQKLHKDLVEDNKKNRTIRISQGDCFKEFSGIMKNFSTEYKDSELSSISSMKIVINSEIEYKGI